MVWVVLAMALLWGWAVSRDDATYAPPEPQAAASVLSAALLFVDGPEGRIDVLEAQTESQLAQYGSGEASFLRGILRSLVRERRIRDLEAGGVFELNLLDNGSLVISDPETRYWMALEAFGVDNRQVFVTLLERAQEFDVATSTADGL
jgi:putative photosynthetic complex assembly protein